MDIRAKLLSVHSKECASLVANHVLGHPDEFGKLIQFMLKDEYRVAQRAAWPLGIVGSQRPEWLLPYFEDILRCLENPPHDAASRNIYRILQNLSIPEAYEGELLEFAMRDLQNPKTAIAIKVFSMTVAFNIASKYQDLLPELRLIIEENLPFGSAGYKSRAKKILAKIDRLVT